MDNGVNVTDAGTLAALRGIGMPYGGYGNFLGDGSAVKSAVDCNRDVAILNRISETTSDQLFTNQIDRVESNLQAVQDRALRDMNQTVRTGDNNLQMQIDRNRTDDNFRALQAEISRNNLSSVQRDADLAKQLSDCCCELKAGQAQILANQECQRQVADAVANAQQNAKLDALLNARGPGNSGGGNS